ncbi:MAG: hypothetical protein HY238_11605 [Acidobacteria bacterium]|nr:hypothetical protein [Acidobacteriota bacterium]
MSFVFPLTPTAAVLHYSHNQPGLAEVAVYRAPGVVLAGLAVSLMPAGWWALRAQQTVSFGKQVLPVLTNNCFKCHGETLQLSGLDLRSRATMLKGGQHGPVIVPGNAEQSRLYRLISGQEKPRMPMDGKLGDAEVATLREWINQGAPWEGSETAAAAPAAPSTKSLEDMEIPAEARNYWALRPAIIGLSASRCATRCRR